MNDESIKAAILKVDTQMKATLAILAGGRAINSNAFDLNNLIIAKKNLQGLLAPVESKKK